MLARKGCPVDEWHLCRRECVLLSNLICMVFRRSDAECKTSKIGVNKGGTPSGGHGVCYGLCLSALLPCIFLHDVTHYFVIRVWLWTCLSHMSATTNRWNHSLHHDRFIITAPQSIQYYVPRYSVHSSVCQYASHRRFFFRVVSY